MKFGLFPKEGGSFDGMISEVQQAEAVGFESCWVCEHHVDDKNYWPAPLIRLANIASVTDNVELVTAVLLPALHNPVGLAERCAMLDQLSEGRLTIGVGLGYVPAEFAAFGVPMEERAGRFVETVRVLDAYLSADEPLSFDGSFASFQDIHPNPTTIQDPRPALWVGGWGELTLQRSVRLGDAWLPGGTADLNQLVTRQEKLRSHVESDNKNWNEREKPLMREVIIAETHEHAEHLCEEHLARTYREEYGSNEWSHPLIKEEDPNDFWDLAEERFFVGTPQEIIEQIEVFRERLDIDHIGCRFHHPGMSHDQVQKQIQLFGGQVIPAFS